MIPGALAEMAFVELGSRGLLNLTEGEINDTAALSRVDRNEYIRQAVRSLNQGVKGADVNKILEVADFVAEREVENVFDEINAELTAAQKNGAKTVIISASPEIFVASFARALNIDHAYGARWHQHEGLVLNDRDQHNNHFDKGQVLHTLAKKLGSVPFAAFGDTRNDIPMFELSEWAVAVNPKPDLRERALASGWEIIDCAPRTNQ